MINKIKENIDVDWLSKGKQNLKEEDEVRFEDMATKPTKRESATLSSIAPTNNSVSPRGSVVG